MLTNYEMSVQSSLPTIWQVWWKPGLCKMRKNILFNTYYSTHTLFFVCFVVVVYCQSFVSIVCSAMFGWCSVGEFLDDMHDMLFWEQAGKTVFGKTWSFIGVIDEVYAFLRPFVITDFFLSSLETYFLILRLRLRLLAVVRSQPHFFFSSINLPYLSPSYERMTCWMYLAIHVVLIYCFDGRTCYFFAGRWIPWAMKH